VAFQYFADEEVDVAVIETGLGGRLDATNVLKPLVSVITSLSMDHVDVLGETLVSIAREKGGIIKTGVPCVTSTQDPDALRALDRIGRRRGTTVDRSWKNVRISEDPRDRRRIRLEGKVFHTGFLRLGLEGEHQRENARIALRACEIVHRSRSAPGARITDEAIERGLVRVRQNTGLRGRSEEIICEGVRVLLDVGHNVDGIRALTDSLKARGFRSPIVLFGALQDKDVAGMVKLLAKTAGHIIGVVPPTKRALGIKGLARIMRQQSIPFTAEGSVRKGFRRALDLARGRAGLVVTGSHYLVGEVIPLLELRKKKPRPA
jgi:dihydrofolate synthase/folylpolyglutamate synthase